MRINVRRTFYPALAPLPGERALPGSGHELARWHTAMQALDATGVGAGGVVAPAKTWCTVRDDE